MEATLRSHATRLTRRVTSIRTLSGAESKRCRYANSNASRNVGALVMMVRSPGGYERAGTYEDPRNHVSVPRRSDRAPIASR
jgi:hypothetical protein